MPCTNTFCLARGEGLKCQEHMVVFTVNPQHRGLTAKFVGVYQRRIIPLQLMCVKMIAHH